MCRTACLILILSLFAAPAAATVYVVQPDGTGDFPTIQAAIDFCADGDVVALADGIFTGDGNRDLDFFGRAITVRSQSGDPAGCVIDCGGSVGDPHRGFFFHNQEGPGSVLQGITIRNGYGHDGASIPAGGAVLCYSSSSPTFVTCVFTDNHAGMTWDHAGGGMYVDNDCDPLIKDCDFRDNSAYFGGGLAVNHWSQATLENCRFIANTAGHGGAIWGNAVTKIHCLFYANQAEQGGAIWSNGFNVDQSESCTFSNNSASGSGGTFYFESNYGDEVQIVDTIIAYSQAGGGIAIVGNVPLVLSCSDIFGNEGGDWISPFAEQVDQAGNFSADPCFCDAAGEDFQLCADSWCLPGHHPWGCQQLVGAYGEVCGACSCGGPVDTETRSWGSLKAHFR